MMKHKFYLIPTALLVTGIVLTGCTNYPEPTPNDATPSVSAPATPDDSAEVTPEPLPDSSETANPEDFVNVTTEYITEGETWVYYSQVGAKKPSEDATPRQTTIEDYKALGGEPEPTSKIFGEVFADAETTAINISQLPNVTEIRSVDEIPASVTVNRYPNMMDVRFLVDEIGGIYVISESKDTEKLLVATVRVKLPGMTEAPIQVDTNN